MDKHLISGQVVAKRHCPDLMVISIRQNPGMKLVYLPSISSSFSRVQEVVMRSLIFTVAVCLFLAGCASGPMYRTERFWQKDGYNFEDAKTAEAQCRYEVNMQQFSNPAEKEETIRACMMMQGFRVGTYKFQVY